MRIQDWPENERPREKLLQRGSATLSDAELLAIFFRTGLPGQTAVDLARTTLNDFGSLRSLLQADRDSFCQKKGLGSASYAQLQAVLELARRYLLENLQRDSVLNNPTDVHNYLRYCLRDAKRELFLCLFLDNQHRVISAETLFMGTIDSASVHPREVVQRALTLNAAAIIFAHNHPSGIAEPSEADRRITRQLQDSLALVDIRVLDHVVIGDNKAISMAERQWL